MNTPGATYIVTVYDSVARVRKTLLSTRDKEKADAMIAAMEQDGVRADLEVLPPKKR